MDRSIDLDAAMIDHLRRQGYTVRIEEPAPTTKLPDLFQVCGIRVVEAGKKYKDAWDYVSNIGLAEIIVMKAMRLRAAIESEFDETAIDSLVDLCNYSQKLYSNIVVPDKED